MSRRLRLNKNPHSLKVGDKVTTDYHLPDREVVRTVLRLTPGTSQSGLLASVDGGKPCLLCGQMPAKSYEKIGAEWLLPIKEKVP